MIFIAHRGASGDYPENTLLAFREALKLGANWLELDVHLSEDGEVVVIHDEQLDRTTSGHSRVGEFPLTALHTFDAGRGEKIPLLREVLELIDGETVLNIELKGVGSAEPTARLLNELFEQERLTPDNLLVSSLDVQELKSFRSLQPDLRMAAVFDRTPDNLWRCVEELNLWSLHVEMELAKEELINEAHRRGVRLFVFTVNDKADMVRLRKLGVDGIFTDYPGLETRAS